jgi:hypothetical protein
MTCYKIVNEIAKKDHLTLAAVDQATRLDLAAR